MSTSTLSAARRWRTRTDIRRFICSVKAWYDKRIGDDPAGQHLTQTTIVRDELLAAAAKLETEANVDVPSVLDAFERCARYDRALGWMWRIFAFFRDKFDQRDDIRFAQALRAADEVVWSCFRPVAARIAPREPAPLPYLDAQYSPAGIRRDRGVDEVIDPGSDFEFLRGYFKTLPLAILRLPLSAIDSPWMLAVIGHEVGHFVQQLVAPDYAMTFQNIVAETVMAASGNATDADAWKQCAGEIFADWYSAAAMGQWALWAMAQFELTSGPLMRVRRTAYGYPSAAARIELLRQLIDRLSGANHATAVTTQLGLTPPEQATADQAPDFGIAAALAKRLEELSLGPLGAITNVVGYAPGDYADDGTVRRWSRVITGKLAGTPRRRLEEARHLAAATVAAWSEVEARDYVSRDPLAASVRKTSFEKIRNSAVEGVRAAPQAVTLPEAGVALVARLLSLDVPVTEENANR